MGEIWIKICGVTSVADAEMVASAGADAIGLNFVAVSPRAVSPEAARDIVQAVGPRVEWVGVFAHTAVSEVRSVAERVGLDWVQLHGEETPAEVLAAGPQAYKAIRVATPADVEMASAFPGERLLVDAKVDGALGGTGAVFDWTLVRELARARRLILAGGLTAENVTQAVRSVRPWGVDAASGVESAPGVKDPVKTRDFVASARSAARALRALD